MFDVLVEAPRGLFYSPKGPRSRCSFLWKAQIAFCLRVHRTPCLQWPSNRLIGCLPFWVGIGLSGGALDMSGDPPDYCRADVVGGCCRADRWRV
jgi:hypothetical protein